MSIHECLCQRLSSAAKAKLNGHYLNTSWLCFPCWTWFSCELTVLSDGHIAVTHKFYVHFPFRVLYKLYASDETFDSTSPSEHNNRKGTRRPVNSCRLLSFWCATRSYANSYTLQAIQSQIINAWRVRYSYWMPSTNTKNKIKRP